MIVAAFWDIAFISAEDGELRVQPFRSWRDADDFRRDALVIDRRYPIELNGPHYRRVPTHFGFSDK